MSTASLNYTKNKKKQQKSINKARLLSNQSLTQSCVSLIQHNEKDTHIFQWSKCLYNKINTATLPTLSSLSYPTLTCFENKDVEGAGSTFNRRNEANDSIWQSSLVNFKRIICNQLTLINREIRFN